MSANSVSLSLSLYACTPPSLCFSLVFSVYVSIHVSTLVSPCVVSVSLGLVGRSGRRRFKNSRCGKWWINAPAFTSKCEELAEQLDLSMQDLSVQQIAKVCHTTSKRITSCRYVDGPEIKAWVRERKALTGAAARRKAKEIADARKQAKQAYLCQLLERGAAGDFRALT